MAPGPSTHAWVVTPDDNDTLVAPTKALYVGALGDVTVQMAGVEDSHPTLFAAVPAGTTLIITATKVLATGTTSNNIVALW